MAKRSEAVTYLFLMSTENHKLPKFADSLPNCQFNRRAFVQGLAAAAGVILVGGCNGDNGAAANTVKAEALGNKFKVPGAGKLKAGEALAFVFPDESPGLAFVARDGSLRALSAKCTHAGCTVVWESSFEILCPCHGSRFDLDGRVLQKPATAPLPAYTARRDGDDIWIEAAK